MELKPHRSIRISGVGCLSPVEVNRAIREVPIGGILEILSNDPCSKDDIKVWARYTGNELVLVDYAGDGWYRFLIRRRR
ncbi:sulfurtransferase TusA family protein [Vulcanisaeta thermophila]|uniref:sulfurtransferase TusA family protein n=1 Tax=Vulcanisaeta thermophila TaxID=867917 RepID=UPI000853957E|nr:sulfurtransferase TusA family protein [Vulcanisaeta thermophila]